MRSEYGGSDLRMFATPTIVMEKANYKGVPRISERQLPRYVEFDGFDVRIVSKRSLCEVPASPVAEGGALG